jgi:biopolymer transport protein ExbD
MIEFDAGKKVRPHISIAPLVDCVLQLLIFFLLSSYFVVQPGIRIRLPEALHARPQEEEIAILINRDNEVYLDEERVEMPRLKGSLEKRLAKSAKKSVTLKADEKIDLGLAIKVMDIAKEAGSEDIVISTRLGEDARRKGD